MRDLLSLNNQKTVEKICRFLKAEFKNRKKRIAILGLSGGLDSSVCAVLCQKAGLDLQGLLLPYRKKNLVDSKKIAEFLKLAKNRVKTIDIGPAVNVQIKDLQKIIKLDKVDQGNLMARQRMIFQYALARKLKGLVIGTEDLSEYYLGYFTLHGDQACDISPISGLFKSQLFQLAEYLGLPQWLLKKKPSPGLWSGHTAEKELGFSYEAADPIIYLYGVKKYPKEKIIKKGFDEKLVNKVLARIKSTEYKRQNPPKL